MGHHSLRLCLFLWTDICHGLFDTCASACFTFDPSIYIPGCQLPVDSGPVNTAAGPALPLATSLQHDNHAVMVESQLVIATALVQSNQLERTIPGLTYLIGAPLYKKLGIGLMQMPGADGPDTLLFGEQLFLSEPLRHTASGLPQALLISDAAVARLMQQGVPRVRPDCLPRLVPYDDSYALTQLLDASLKLPSDAHVLARRVSPPLFQNELTQLAIQSFAVFSQHTWEDDDRT